MAKENDLGHDSIFKLLLKLTIPSMLAQIVNVLYGIVDRIFISNIIGIGDLALAGVGVTAPIITLITSFSFLVGLGGAPLVAIKLGEGKKDEAQRVMTCSFIMLTVVSVLLTIVFLLLKNNLLMWFGASQETFLYANEYLTVYLFGSVFAMLSLGLNVFISCQGFSKIAMLSVLVGAVINVILDPLFIFTLNMGVKGAALATVIAQFVSCAWVIIFLCGKRTIVKISFKGFSKKISKKIMGLGLSPFLIMSTESVIIIALNTVLQKTGGADADNLIAAATIMLSFMQLIINPLGGLTLGAQPIMSYNYGACKTDRILKAFKGLLIICLIFTSIMFTLAMAIPQYFVKIFTSDPNIANLAVWGIRVHTSGIIILSMQYATVDTFTALSSPKHAVSLSLSRKLGYILILTILLPLIFGAKYAFMAEPIADVIGGIVSTIVYLCCMKKLLKKREDSMKIIQIN